MIGMPIFYVCVLKFCYFVITLYNLIYIVCIFLYNNRI